MINYSIIPIEVVYEHILSYMDLKSLYMIRNTCMGINDIYLFMYTRTSNKDRALLAIEVEDEDMLRECLLEWPVDYIDIMIDNVFYRNIFDIARKKRSMNMIFILLSSKVYEHVGYGKLILDTDMIQILYDNIDTREFVTNYVSIVLASYDNSAEIFISENIKLITLNVNIVTTNKVKLEYICSCMSVAIITCQYSKLEELRKMRESLLDI
jgi:hypothetical protein